MQLPPAQWAQNEFALAELGDRRLNQRLVNIATELAVRPSGTLPQAFPDWAELKAAYRFFNHPRVSFERVLAPHWERTRRQCGQPGEYLLIEDTTLLDYSGHRATAALGRIGDGAGRGFELHSALAVRVEAWTLEQRLEGTVLGLFAQQCRTPRAAPAGETCRERLGRPRKSQTWAAAFKAAGRPPAGCQWIYVADRESDFYEPLQICRQHGVDFVIRASPDRRLAGVAGHLRTVLAEATVLGEHTVEVRAQAGQPARSVRLAVRGVRVALAGPWRPGGWQPPLLDIGAVELRETAPPPGVTQPLHWVLLTSLACATLAEARRVAGRYAARWQIEEYHKALKSGTRVEASQLAHGHRLTALIAVLAVVAVRLLSLKMVARRQPASLAMAASFGPELLALLEQKIGPPRDGWTNQNLMTAIARLGGFLARKHDGFPGWQTIWRGWQRLMQMAEGANLMKDAKRCG